VDVQGESGLENEDGKEYVQNEVPIHIAAPSDRRTQRMNDLVPQSVVVVPSPFGVLLVSGFGMLGVSGFSVLLMSGVSVSGFGMLLMSSFSVFGGSSACLIYINPIQSSQSQTDKQEKNRKR
jgi:hypothetical protein